ncbi:MAG: hypothetical protein FJ257_02310 [Phycisphaerae bacterium]|nr:hypothetical protein [Phycisphaerae bacterium]
MDILSGGTNFLLILAGFGLLIFVHELGHFLAARWAGIRVDGFAVGMGPTVVSWRRGIGPCLGSTEPKVLARTGRATLELSDERLRELGLGETEYSLRLLPLGGFVKMLGQDDLDPNASSESARSYTRCPIGRRMVVVSAGVVANLILAIVLFLVAFLVGVRFEAPMIGEVRAGSPAATAVGRTAHGGEVAGGLRAGDVVRTIDGARVETFSDVQIASAMARRDQVLVFEVEREGLADPIRFEILPVLDEASGLLAIGVAPAAGTVLASDDEILPFVQRALDRTELADAGVLPGARLATVEGREVRTFDEVVAAVAAGDGRPVDVTWTNPDGASISAPLPAEPTFQRLVYPTRMPAGAGDYDFGLLGLVPLTRIGQVLESSPNRGVLEPGDVVLRIGSLDGPRLAELRALVQSEPGGSLPILVRRGSESRSLEVRIDRDGRLGVEVGYDREQPLVARPFDRLGRLADGEIEPVPSPAAPLDLMPRSRLLALDGRSIDDWASFRAILREQTADAFSRGEGVELALTVLPPTPEAPAIEQRWSLDAAAVAEVQSLGWTTSLPPEFLDPVYTRLSADGSPLRAVAMGFEQTWKMVTLTYLTIDRLLRGTVGVEQLHGPVGIVHLGTRVADRGITYLVFFLAMISVNLAVLNFLPLPIVDGGLFLFLIYERLRGRPPSPAFQNAATLVGLMLIGGLFVITFYNDLMRLLG